MRGYLACNLRVSRVPCAAMLVAGRVRSTQTSVSEWRGTKWRPNTAAVVSVNSVE